MRQHTLRPKRTGARLPAAWALAAIVAVGLAAPCPAAGDGAKGPAERLLAVRNALHQRLADRMAAEAKAEAPSDVALLIEGGLEHHGTRAYGDLSGVEMIPMELVMQRRGGKWLAPRVSVPGELGEWLDVLGVEADDLALKPEGMSGSARLVSKLGRPGSADLGRGNSKHGHLKSGTIPVFEWNILRKGVRPHEQRFDFDTRLLPDRWNFSLVFHGGLRGTAVNERIQQETEWAKDLSLTRYWVSQDYALLEGRSPAYNLAVHENDPSGLKWSDGRLTGTVVAHVQRDGWTRGGTQVYRIDARLAGGRIADGTYTVSGDFGEYSGRVSGYVGRALSGTYRTGDFGRQWSGTVMGTLIDVPSAPVAIDGKADAALLAGAKTAGELAELGARFYREAAGLARALREYPLQWNVAARGMHVETPELKGDAAAEATVERFLGSLATLAETAADESCPAPVDGNVVPADEDFGPYFPAAPLDEAKAGGNGVPSVSSERIGQQWQYPTRWEFVGPFVTQRTAGAGSVELPEVALAEGVSYLEDWRGDGRLLLAGKTVAWGEGDSEGDAVRLPRSLWNGLWVRSGRLSTYGDHMKETKSDEERQMISEESSRAYHWYARTSLESPKDQTVYLAVRAQDGGHAWVNGRLCWRSGEGYDNRSWAIFPVTLHAGANELLVRTGEPATYFPGMGKGWNEETAAAARSWMQIMVCTQGKPWPAEEARRQLDQEAAAMARKLPGKVHGPLGDGTAVYPDADPPLVWDIEKGTNVRWRRQMPTGSADVVVWDDRLYVNAEPAVLSCLDKTTGEVRWTARPEASGAGDARGPTASATPLVDEGTVWVHYGTGVVVAYGHDGRRKWQTSTGAPWSGLEHASPLLAGRDAEGRRRLVVVAPDVRTDGKRREVLHQVVALDADTGRELWRSGGLPQGPVGILYVPLVRGDLVRDVIVDADGTVIDAADGQVVCPPLDRYQWGQPPAWGEPPRRVGTRIYLGHAETALRIWLEDRDRIGRRILYHHGRGGGANPVMADDGLIYVLRVTEEHSAHGPTPWDMLQAIDRETGFTVAKHKPALRNATRPTSAALVGEKRLLFLADNGGGLGADDDLPKLAIIEAGEVPKPIYDQTFMVTGSHPVFDGDRFYVQGEGAVWCFGVTGEKGKELQEAALAERIIRWRLRKPPTIPVTDIPAVEGYAAPAGLKVVRMGTWTSPRDWLFAGPLPRGPADADPLSPITAPGGIAGIAAGTPVTWQGTTRTFGALPEGVLLSAGTRQEYYEGDRSFRSSYGLRYAKAVDATSDTCAYYFTALESPVPATYQVNITGSGARLWMGGVPLEDKQIFHLEKGVHPLLMRMDCGRLPPADLADKMWVHLTFRRIPDPQRGYDTWIREIQAYRPWLERFTTTMAGTALGRSAAAYLDAAEEADRPVRVAGP